MDKDVLFRRLKTQMIGTDEQLWAFTMMSYKRRKDCKALQRSLAELHKIHGSRDVEGGWGVTPVVRERRWQFIHTMALELCLMGFRLAHYRGFKQKHVIALCRLWESEGQAPSTLLYKKSLIKTVLIWAGKSPKLFAELSDEQLFKNPQALENAVIQEE